MDDKEKTKAQLIDELDELRQGIAEANRRHQISAGIANVLNIDQSPEEAMQQVGAILQQSIPYKSLSIRLQEVSWRYLLEDGHCERQEVDESLWDLKKPNYTAIGWVFQNGQPLVRGDISKQRRFECDGGLIEEGTISQLIVPLIVNGEAIGAFNFTSPKANCYDGGHLETAQSIADAIALMVKQFETRQEIAHIQEITAAIQESLNLDEILEMILKHIRSQGYDRVRLYFYDEAQHAMVGVKQIGLEEDIGFVPSVHPLETESYSLQPLTYDGPQIKQVGTQKHMQVLREYERANLFEISKSREFCVIPLKISEAGP